MLELAVPVLAALVATPGQVDPQAAMAFFLIGAVHVALMVMVLKVTGTMVGGWRVFGLAPLHDHGAHQHGVAPQTVALTTSPAAAPSTTGRPQTAAVSLVQPAAPAANDMGGASDQATSRRNQVFVARDGFAKAQGTGNGPSRAAGIGSRFRPARPASPERIR